MKTLKIAIIALAIALISISTASALLGPGSGGGGPLTPSALCKVASSTWAFCDTDTVLGDASNKISNGNFTALTIGTAQISTATVSAIVSGNMDMNNNLILNIGNAGTDFTSTGGLTLAGELTGNATATFAGNVGIGTTIPNNLLQVFDLINFDNADFNTKIGYQAGKNIVSGATNNTFVGYQAGFSSVASSTDVADSNVAIGHQSLFSNLAGHDNIANGMYSLYDLTEGYNNVAIGHNTGRGITTGNNNTIIGAGVGSLAVNLNNNIIIADGAGNRRINVDGTGNVGIGTTTPAYTLDVFGTIRGQDYRSADGTLGWTGTCAAASSTVFKNGLVTGCI